jgi:hypothetical protein
MNRKYETGNTRVIGKNTHHKRPKNPGVVMLTQKADKKVLETCSEITEALAAQAIKGNASSARLLVDLAEGAEWVGDPEAVEKVLSLVETWAKELKAPEDEVGEMPAGVLAPSGELTTLSNSACSTFVN